MASFSLTSLSVKSIKGRKARDISRNEGTEAKSGKNRAEVNETVEGLVCQIEKPVQRGNIHGKAGVLP
ncbi:MAG: hypothetical protein ACTSW1_09820 [Candidatus Hodarchaeales archaeon]